MALDRRELLKRIGMGGVAMAAIPFMPPPSGEVLLPVEQTVERVPTSIITPDLVAQADFGGGWMLVSSTIRARWGGYTSLFCEFVQRNPSHGGQDVGPVMGQW